MKITVVYTAGSHVFSNLTRQIIHEIRKNFESNTQLEIESRPLGGNTGHLDVMIGEEPNCKAIWLRYVDGLLCDLTIPKLIERIRDIYENFL